MQILKCGMASIQDTGRTGYRNLGINNGGVMDRTSFALCNMLVANDLRDALVEINGGEWVSVSDHAKLIVVGGKGYNVFAGDQQLNLWQPYFLEPGVRLKILPLTGGGIAYLAIHGGIRINTILGSRSTHLTAGFGGKEGRMLRTGDVLPTAILRTALAEKIVLYLHRPGMKHQLRLSNAAIPDFSRNTIRIFAAHEYSWFTPAAQTLLGTSGFELTGMSNRMGYRFNGPALQLHHERQLLSTAVLPGTIQVSPDGQLLILMADAQTAGGYPRIGQVISTDIPLLAQKSPGSRLQFKVITASEAEAVYLKREEQLANLKKDFSLIFA
ncbi:biotin-dependent carboxyltransferase family protein [Flavihumibacter fluvii]|uniref:5-oxoprolinase subunit C family protein n=1 Tax=Flavihumibacter fluvii TaxID=2838157 RepID=UPI001BDECFF3|nr:biotin-dependent carboxyltransferase family protein [Flavihumibacter fluvii]ULQ51652.1 biotin-dependent carboxyltransferase family protein [Flavihumibacter fluvii]